MLAQLNIAKKNAHHEGQKWCEQISRDIRRDACSGQLGHRVRHGLHLIHRRHRFSPRLPQQHMISVTCGIYMAAALFLR